MRNLLLALLALSFGIINPVQAENFSPLTDSSKVIVIPRESNMLKGLEKSYSGLDYKSAVQKYLPLLDNNFTVTRFQHFVVLSEADEETTYKLINGELRTIAEHMQEYYVEKRPANVTTIIVFDSFAKYKRILETRLDIKNVKERNTGYHSKKRSLIVMRHIAGKGTILHEATHTYMKYDFPESPIWFDEGLASIHESADMVDNKLTGGFSLRLLTLKTALVKGSYNGLEEMMGMTSKEFYGEKSLLNYANARYILMYLQERNLLERYYKLFRDTYDMDNTGIKQLESLLGKKLPQIETDYILYVYSFKGIYP